MIVRPVPASERVVLPELMPMFMLPMSFSILAHSYEWPLITRVALYFFISVGLPVLNTLIASIMTASLSLSLWALMLWRGMSRRGPLQVYEYVE